MFQRKNRKAQEVFPVVSVAQVAVNRDTDHKQDEEGAVQESDEVVVDVEVLLYFRDQNG
jgi:hypothetical protein